MNTLTWKSPLELLWIAFIAVWVLSARRAPTPTHRDTREIRFAINGVLAIGGVLLFAGGFVSPTLRRGFLVGGPLLNDVALLLTACGLALAVWARLRLGRFWTGGVGVVDQHTLVQSGPYARVRHPIYSGVLIAAAGTALAVDEVRAIAGFALLLVGLAWKAWREERFMARELGGTYARYRDRTGFLFPRLRR